MTPEELQKLREDRARAFESLKTLVDASEKEDRAENRGQFTAEEQEQYDRMTADLDRLDARLERHEQLARRQAWANQPEPNPIHQGQPGPIDPTAAGGDEPPASRDRRDSPEYRAVFRAFLRGGLPAVYQIPEQRALQADADISGGYLVPPTQWVNQLIAAKKNSVFVRQYANVIPVTSGDSLGVPSLDTDVADASWTAEIGSASEDSSLVFGKRELHPHALAKLVKISNKLLRVSALDPEAIVQDRLAYKFGVTEEQAFLTGSGSQQPLGVFTASDNGISTSRDVSTGNTTTTIGADGLIEAAHTLKSQYWSNARWLFHRDAIKMIRKLKDGEGQYLWQPGIAAGQGNRILNFPYDVSEYASNTFTAGLYVGILADWKYYWIADALSFTVQRLLELYAETNQVGLIGRAEVDGMPVLEEAFVRVTLAS